MKLSKLVSAVALLAACTAASAQIQERILRFGNVVQADAPLAIGMQKFADIVAAKSGGKIKVQVIGGGALGSESQQLSSVQGGVLDMTLPSATIMGTVVKDFTMLDFPFSFNKEEQADALVDGTWGKAAMAKLPEKGMIGLGFWETGFRQFTNSRKPIVNIEDLKGLKLRVIPNPMFMDSFGALGTNPVPMAFTELYGALESKAMDAQENAVEQGIVQHVEHEITTRIIDFQDPRQEWRRITSEIVGTFFLVMVAAGGGMIVNMSVATSENWRATAPKSAPSRIWRT